MHTSTERDRIFNNLTNTLDATSTIDPNDADNVLLD